MMIKNYTSIISFTLALLLLAGCSSTQHVQKKKQFSGSQAKAEYAQQPNVVAEAEATEADIMTSLPTHVKRSPSSHPLSGMSAKKKAFKKKNKKLRNTINSLVDIATYTPITPLISGIKAKKGTQISIVNLILILLIAALVIALLTGDSFGGALKALLWIVIGVLLIVLLIKWINED